MKATRTAAKSVFLLIIPLVLLFASCEADMELGGDLKASLEEGSSTNFVFYDTDETSTICTQSYKINTNVAANDLPSSQNSDAVYKYKRGYDVVGWSFYKNLYTGSTTTDGLPVNTSENGTYTLVTNVGITPQPLALKAVDWKAITYYITYNANGGTGSMAATACTYDTQVTLSENAFTRIGYTFAGWNTPSGATYNDKASVTNLADRAGAVVPLYAQWTPITYTVRFNSNSGSGNMPDQTLIYDTPAALTPNAFTRDGYTFIGWSTPSSVTATSANSGSVTYKDKATVKNLSSTERDVVQLYAVWKQGIDLYFNANGGSGSISPLNVVTDATLPTGSALTRAGYTFAGWSKTAGGSVAYSDGEQVAATNFSGDTTLYAVWTANTNTPYKVEHYLQNITGNGYTLDSDSTENKTGTTDKPTAATAKTYTGFNTPSVTQMDINGNGTTVVKIYYTRKTITLTFKPNGGAWGTSTGNKTVQGRYGASVSSNAVSSPTREGYVFNEWDPEIPSTFTEDQTLTAQWTRITCTVKFNANNGTGSMAERTLNYGDALTANTFTREGYTFLGWSTESGIQNVTYADGAAVKPAPNGTTINLYAQWVKVDVVKKQGYPIPPNTQSNVAEPNVSKGSVTFTASGGDSYIWGLDGSKKSTTSSFTVSYTDLGRNGASHTVTAVVFNSEGMPLYYYEVTVTISG